MKIKITKRGKSLNEAKQPVNEALPQALAAFGPKILKGIGKMLGGLFDDDDAEKIAKEIIDQSQTDPIVMKGQDISDIEAVLRAILDQISQMAAAQSTDSLPSPAEREAADAEAAPDAESDAEAPGLKPGPAGTKVKNPKIARVVGAQSPLATGGDIKQSSKNLASMGKKALASRALRGKKV